MGPERGSDHWKEQVVRVTKLLRNAKEKKDISTLAFLFIADRSYARSAITQAIHDVEIEKGWHT